MCHQQLKRHYSVNADVFCSQTDIIFNLTNRKNFILKNTSVIKTVIFTRINLKKRYLSKTIKKIIITKLLYTNNNALIDLLMPDYSI